MSATPASSYRDSPPGDEDENSNASDHQSTALDPPEEGDYYDSDSSSYGSPPRNYEMGDIRYSSPDKGSRAVSPPASIWGRKYSDNHSESLREVPLPMGGPYAPPFDVEDQMHRELHDIPLRRRSSPIYKCLIGAAIFSLLVVGSVVVKNKHRTNAPLPSFDEQLNAQNPVIEGVPASVESVAATEGSNGNNEQSSSSSEQDLATASTAEQSTPKGEESNEGSAGESTSSSSEQDVKVDVATAATATVEESTPKEEESNQGSGGESASSSGEQDVQVDVATVATATAAVEQSTPKEEESNEGSAGEISSTNGDIVTSSNTKVDDAVTATTKPTPYVPKNEAGDIDVGQWCGGCSSGIPGVNCDKRVEYVGKKYNTPELDAKIELMENGKCHIATAAEVAAQRHTYPCRKTPEDQGGKEGAEKFCGYCRWQNSDFDCFTRVTFLMSTYHITELEAMQGLIEGNHCVLPDNYMEQFNKEKQDGTEEWCGYCKWDTHTCETKLNWYTSSGEKTIVTVKTEILDDGHCKKQPLCDANSS